MSPFFFKKLQNIESDFIEEIIEFREKPSIIHYSGYIKPWHKECEHPYKDLYWQALKGTKWEANFKASREKNIIKRIKLKIRQILKGNPYYKSNIE